MRIHTLASAFALFTAITFISREVCADTQTTAMGVPVEGQVQDAADLNVSDPLEPFNRGMFWFNDKLDRYLLEPVSKGYRDITPDFVREGVGNFFNNLEYPIDLVADIIELNFSQAASDTGRFVLNTTVGVAGLVDVGSKVGLEKNKGDIGTALARDGVPAGPYLVLPFYGPSTIRDGVGLAASAFLSPTAIMAYAGVDNDVTLWTTVGTKALEVVDTRARLDEAIKTSRESAIDQYLFVQSAYYQYRNGIINNSRQKSASELLNED